MDADRKLLLDELQQVDGVDARHGQRVEEEGDGRAGGGRRPAGQEDEACEYGWTVISGLCTYKVTSQFILGPKIFFVTGLVIFATALARLVCPDLLG